METKKAYSPTLRSRDSHGPNAIMQACIISQKDADTLSLYLIILDTIQLYDINII